jgi:tungstate transport system ATP-binding protein
LQLARALATGPEVLLLDEPTASLDPAATATIEALVREVSEQGVKVIYVTHDIGQARRLADDVVFLAAGRVAEHASAIEFFEKPSSADARAYLAGQLLVSGKP